MRKLLLCGCAVAMWTVPILCAAPSPTPSPASETRADAVRLEGNYALTLYPPADHKGVPELAIIVALCAFDATQDPARLQSTFDVENNSGQPRVHLRGTISPQKDGLFLLSYYLENGNATASSALLLRPGEPVQMIKNGDQFYNLRLERYNTPTPR